MAEDMKDHKECSFTSHMPGHPNVFCINHQMYVRRPLEKGNNDD